MQAAAWAGGKRERSRADAVLRGPDPASASGRGAQTWGRFGVSAGPVGSACRGVGERGLGDLFSPRPVSCWPPWGVCGFKPCSPLPACLSLPWRWRERSAPRPPRHFNRAFPPRYLTRGSPSIAFLFFRGLGEHFHRKRVASRALSSSNRASL